MDTLPEVGKLIELVDNSSIPHELREKTHKLIDQVSLNLKLGMNLSLVGQISRYINWIVSLPWNVRTQDNLDLKVASEIYNKTHFGLDEIKERIFEYLAVLKLLRLKNNSQIIRAPILCFVGLAGTGKTTIAQTIAASLSRNFFRIPLGGMSSSLELRGQSQFIPNAEPGKIIKALVKTRSQNSVILLDEIDRVADEARADIMSVLLEILDPEQNSNFIDNYIDYPFNLSEILFIATANNTGNISTAVLDRLEPIQMPSYNDEEKIMIAKNYMLPKKMAEMGIDQSTLKIDDQVWPSIVRPLGFDSGIRSLERTIAGICRRVAKKIIENQGMSFNISTQNLKEFVSTW